MKLSPREKEKDVFIYSEAQIKFNNEKRELEEEKSSSFK